jgi:2-oxoglutarate dehydrogenase E1 component
MGGWSFQEPRLRALVGSDVSYVGRDASASPATGSRQIHLREQKELIEAALQGTGTHLVRAVSRSRALPRRDAKPQAAGRVPGEK